MRWIGLPARSTRSKSSPTQAYELCNHSRRRISKPKRKKKEDEDGDVTYINDRNKVFNKKIARYFDKYTTECVLSL